MLFHMKMLNDNRIGVLTIFIWLFTRFVLVLSLRPLKVNLGTIGLYQPVVGGALPFTAPAFDMALIDAKTMYNDTLDITHEYISRWAFKSCDPELVENAEDLAAEFYYRTVDNADVTAIISPAAPSSCSSDEHYRVTGTLLYDTIHDFSGVWSDCKMASGLLLVGLLCGCNEVFDTNRLATQWNVLFASTSSDFGFVQNRTKNPNWVSLATGTFSNILNSCARLLSDYQWTNVYFVWESGASNPMFRAFFYGLTAMLRNNASMQPIFRTMDIKTDTLEQRRSLLEEFRRSSRVMVFFGHSDYLRQTLILAHALNMTTDEYVYIGLQSLFHYGTVGNFSWRFNDSNDTEAKLAYRRVFLLGAEHSDNQTNIDRQDPYINEWKRQSLLQWNISVNEPSPYLRVSYASIMILAEILNETYVNNLQFNFRDGVGIADMFLGRSFTTKVMPVSVGGNGNILVNLTLRFTNSLTDQLEVVAIWDGKNQYFVPVQNISWPHNQGPPRNRPVCGYLGDDAACLPTSDKRSIIGGVLGTLFAVTVLGVVITLVLLRARAMREINMNLWMINPLDIITFRGSSMHGTFYNPSRQFTSRTISFNRLADNSLIVKSRRQQKSYHGQLIWINSLTANPVNKVTVHDIFQQPDRFMQHLMNEIWNCSHLNINQFVGLFSIPGKAPDNYFIHAVSSWCSRGSLCDLFNAHELDYSFRLSFIHNLLEGMRYIHSSTLRFHGNLLATKCLLDRHFTLKIADYGYCQIMSYIHGHAHDAYYNFSSLRVKLGQRRKSEWHLLHQSTDVQAVGKVMKEIIEWNRADEHDDIEVDASSKNVDDVVSKMVNRCLQEDRSMRPSIKQVLREFEDLLDSTDEHRGSMTEKIIYRLEAYFAKLEQEVTLRSQQLQHEKLKNESLLRELLPRVVMQQLRRGIYTTADLYDNVTIFFSDVVGFSALISSIGPMDVFVLLAQIFRIQDMAIAGMDVYKVETIGDCYMVASGLPLKNGNEHAQNISIMAAKMLELFRESDTMKLMDLLFKAGIHSGPCAAGVIGLNRPRYCLFGDTVNVASRMCSQGEADKIQISATTATLLFTHYPNILLQSRSVIDLRGWGKMQTYWLCVV